jgi:hypothetical protein
LAQSKSHDTAAVVILDRMAEMIGNLESCTFKVDIQNDVVEQPYGLVKKFSNFEVFMSGPNKMMLNGHGAKGHRQFLYNGQQMAYYSYDDNNYGMIPTPTTTIQTIDSINKHYGIEFPAADFFYPAFTDDLLETSDSVRYLGIVKVGDKEYFHIIAFNKEMNLQFWVNNDSYNLPGIYSITYKTESGSPQYLATFSDWQINPKLPDAMFEFTPPPGAHRVRILSKSEE